MCKLCENKSRAGKIVKGWLYLERNGKTIEFPVHHCPWCGEKQKEERIMPGITPREWKWEMQEQEAENYDPSEDLC